MFNQLFSYRFKAPHDRRADASVRGWTFHEAVAALLVIMTVVTAVAAIRMACAAPF